MYIKIVDIKSNLKFQFADFIFISQLNYWVQEIFYNNIASAMNHANNINIKLQSHEKGNSNKGSVYKIHVP